MRLILAVYDALRSFARPCTRAEIQRESNLDKDAVHVGLRGLERRQLLVITGNPRSRGLYQLKLGAPRPEDQRGKYVRAAEFRVQASAARQEHRAARPAFTAAVAAAPAAPVPYRPSSAPSHQGQPGALRHQVKSGHGSTGGATTFATCTLAQVWRRG